jgi:predicted nucleotidyltransferase
LSLLKMAPNPKLNNWAQNKAIEVLKSVPSYDLISEAYLFGSAVDGNFTYDSDLDILIVTKDEASISQIQNEVYKLNFTDIAIDWIFKTKEAFDERKNFGGVTFVAYHSGMKLK